MTNLLDLHTLGHNSLWTQYFGARAAAGITLLAAACAFGPDPTASSGSSSSTVGAALPEDPSDSSTTATAQATDTKEMLHTGTFGSSATAYTSTSGSTSNPTSGSTETSGGELTGSNAFPCEIDDFMPAGAGEISIRWIGILDEAATGCPEPDAPWIGGPLFPGDELSEFCLYKWPDIDDVAGAEAALCGLPYDGERPPWLWMERDIDIGPV